MRIFDKSKPVQIGPYRLIRKLGEGGMGSVYLAKYIDNGFPVALKILKPELANNLEYIQEFLSEYEKMRGIRHPNIIQVYDFGQVDGIYYIASQYVKGGSLEDRLERGWRPNLPTALSIVRQLAVALDTAHQQGIVHCDLKPGNVLMDKSGRVWLTDFGIAHRVRSQSPNATGTLPLTPAYCSPEQALQASGQQVNVSLNEAAFLESFPLPDDAELVQVVEGFDGGFASSMTEPELFDAYGEWLEGQGWTQQAPAEATVTLPHQVWRTARGELLLEIQGLDDQGRTVLWLKVTKVQPFTLKPATEPITATGTPPASN